MIRVLLVDDSPLALALLTRMLAQAPEVVVAGTARNGRDAIRQLPGIKPDVICTDLEMPEMDGFEFISSVMQTSPCPILVVSNYLDAQHARNAFHALELGAIDVFPKPRPSPDGINRADTEQLLQKIRVLSGVVPFRRRASVSSAPMPVRGLPAAPGPARIVVIGASTGGPQALRTVLEALPASLAVPLVCVQHISADFRRSFVEWLQRTTGRVATVVEGRERPVGGHAYFPRPDRHLLVDETGCLVCSDTPPFNGHRPSISLTFTSAAAHFGSATMGVLLTGMGRDGADGMEAIVNVGGTTVAQDEETSVVFGMARQAIELGAAQHVLPLSRIAEMIARCTSAPPDKR